MKKLILAVLIILAHLPAEASAQAGDKIESHRFKLGDSTVTFFAAPNTDIFIESYDSTGSGTDTHKVYIVDTWGNKTLATLENANDTNFASKTIYSTFSPGVIVTSTSAGSFWRVVYPYPTQIFIARTNAVNLTDISKCVIKAMKKP